MRNKNIYAAMLVCLACGFAQSRPGDDLTARDAFYSAADLIGLGRAAPPDPHKPLPPGKARTGSADRKAEVAHVQVPADPEAHFLPADPNLPLGLRYSVLKQAGAGTLLETKPGDEFHNGDLIRLNVMSNHTGYLYIIARGSSGLWHPLFPSPDSVQRNNEVVAGRSYLVPEDDHEAFQFVGQPGEERLFLLFSRTPVADLDAIIAELAAQSGEQPGPPAVQHEKDIDDALVGSLREMVHSRDLIFTKIHEDPVTPKVAGETAVYVVNKKSAGTTNGRVVADVVLSHR